MPFPALSTTALKPACFLNNQKLNRSHRSYTRTCAHEDKKATPVWRRGGSMALGGLLAMGLSLGSPVELIVEPAAALEEQTQITPPNGPQTSLAKRREMLSSLREKALEEASDVKDPVQSNPKSELEEDRRSLLSSKPMSALEKYESLTGGGPAVPKAESGGFFSMFGKKDKKEADSAPDKAKPSQEPAQRGFSMPKAPKIDAPPLPKLEAPKFSVPAMPKFEVPKLPGPMPSESGDSKATGSSGTSGSASSKLQLPKSPDFGNFFGNKEADSSTTSKSSADAKKPIPEAPQKPRFGVPKIETPSSQLLSGSEDKKESRPGKDSSSAPSKFEAPSLPKLETPSLPKFEAPSMPKFSSPSLPKFNAPSLPKFSAPSLPESKAPIDEASGSKGTTPVSPETPSKVPMPKFGVPSIPKLETPSFEAPSFPKFEVPSFKGPSMPNDQSPSSPGSSQQSTSKNAPAGSKDTSPAKPPSTIPKFSAPSVPEFQPPPPPSQRKPEVPPKAETPPVREFQPSPKIVVPPVSPLPSVPKVEAPPMPKPTLPEAPEGGAIKTEPKQVPSAGAGPNKDTPFFSRTLPDSESKKAKEEDKAESAQSLLKSFGGPQNPSPKPDRSAAVPLPLPVPAPVRQQEKPKLPEQPQSLSREDLKKVKPSKDGALPLWAAQFFMLIFYSGIIAGLTVYYDETSGPLESAFKWADKTLEKLSLPEMDKQKE